ncbi:hypothetical protein Zmor_002390 [Zophobas morio]|uniref:Odorant receptor n=1 Tax=Zophobas morio TaxID=2755281 RepID=A0AA38J4Y2_9CUCU|nr:hypothetical protein Zmor_002390 [Zophobas morio]
MERVADYSFTLNISVLKFLGFYPVKSYKVLHKVYACILYTLVMIPVAIFIVLHFVFAEDRTDFKHNDFVMVAMLLYVCKFFPWLLQSNKFKHCIHYFDQLYDAVKEHEKHVEDCSAVCRRNSKIFFVGCVSAIFGFVGQACVNSDELPLNVWVPTVIRQKPLYYGFIYVLCLLTPSYSALTTGAIDPLIGGLCYQATVHIQILQKKLQHLDKDISEQFSSSGLTKSGKIFLRIKKCIRHHQAIQNFVQEFQDCFSSVVFSQFAGSSLVIGILCFQMSKVTVGVGFLIMVNDLGVVFFQILFYCYYGTLLLEENQNLMNAVYMSRWYEFDIQCRKALIMLMEGSKKPMVVTAGKLFPLSLDTFTMILRRSYSLVAVLKSY